MSNSVRNALVAALTFALAAPAAAQPVRVQLPKNAPASQREAPRRLTPEETRSGPNRAQMRARGLFHLDFEKVDIEKLVQTISDMTGRLFILPENVRGKISIIGPEHGKVGVTADEAYAAFLAALDANGLTVYPVGKYLKIVDKRSGKQSNIPTYTEDGVPYTTNEQMITKLFKLRYVEVEPVRAVVQQLVSKDGDTLSFPPDTLIVNDIGLNMHRLEKIITKLDSPAASDEIRIIQVQYATASEVAEKLRQVFEDKSKRPGAPARAPTPARGAAARNVPGQPTQPDAEEAGAASISQIIPDERSNKLIVIGNEKAFERISLLLKHLDTPTQGEGQVHVYYLANANAEELANTLSSLTQGVQQRTGGRPPPGGAQAAQARGQQTVADLFSGEVKITADKGTNSLVIIASGSDYRSLARVIEKLDISRRQVFVEAVIMEVNLKNDSQFGLSVHTGSPASLLNPDDSLAVIGSQTGRVNSLSGVLSLASLGGFLAGLQGPVIADTPIPSFSIVLQALQTSSDVNVLSTPHILTSDNEDAEITVGQNVPFQAGITPNLFGGLGGLGTTTGTTAATSALASTALLGGFSGLIAPIQRQNVELKLKIKPQINESDYIRLQIEEQTEEIAEQDQRLGPTTAKRTAKTTVVAKDQQTVVIGGLIQERQVRAVQKVPLLGDIPVLGWLFRDTVVTKNRTNLLLFLTPYIIRDQSDFRRIFERKLRERQEFVEQFYGRQPGYVVPIDYERKSGPMTTMLKSIAEEKLKAENGGPGAPGERVITPSERPRSNAAPLEAGEPMPPGEAIEEAPPVIDGEGPEISAPPVEPGFEPEDRLTPQPAAPGDEE